MENPLFQFGKALVCVVCACALASASGAQISAGQQSQETRHLLDALAFGSESQAHSLLAGNVDVNAKNQFGFTPLIFAAGKGYQDIVETLLAKGANVNAKSDDGETPLGAAAESDNNLEIVKLLLANNADINARNSRNETPLHTAAYFGSIGIAGLLIADGADVNARASDGGTPLIKSVSGQDYLQTNSRDVVELLLSHGADPNAEDNKGRTALYYAIEDGHKSVLELLQPKRTDKGETSPATKDNIETLIAVLNDSESTDAAEALGNSRDPRALAPLVAAFKPWSHAAGTELLAPVVAKALGNLGDPRAVGPLIACLKEPDGSLQISTQIRALISKAQATTDPTQRQTTQFDAVQRYLEEVGQRDETAKAEADAEMKAANSQDPDWWKIRSVVRSALPQNRETDVVYWVQASSLDANEFVLKKTVPCDSSGGVFLAETMVPCGAVFVNSENQIGGNYHFIPASENDEPTNVYWRNTTRLAAVEALRELGTAAVQPLIDYLTKE